LFWTSHSAAGKVTKVAPSAHIERVLPSEVPSLSPILWFFILFAGLPKAYSARDLFGGFFMPTPSPRVSVRTRRAALVGLAIITLSLVIAAAIATYQRQQPPVQ